MTTYAPPWWCPPVDGDALVAVVDGLRAGGIDIVAEQPLGPWTTLGVGGSAEVFAEIGDDGQLMTLMRSLAEVDESMVPLLVIGRGSNLLIADSGWPGLAIRLGAAFKTFTRTGLRVSARAAASMPALAAWAATQGLSGLEFAAGIPATVGGSVRMNAGAHGGEVAQRLVAAQIAVPGRAEISMVSAAELQFSYRRSVLPPRAVIAGAQWELFADDAEAIRARLDDLRAWRRSTQPLRQRNCGSVFTNPDGDSAGRLVDAAGLKGRRRGGAQVSERHANFIVVDPPCAAADVYGLITELRRVVHLTGGPLLQPEVRIIGDFGKAAADAGE
ncbi:MAG: UDP-N-acetylmuramate dehydrogenase [Frankiaceae bacterium]|nr:UDP-N-acetylmuramate dehydrogenase [Frankiaceae bacterium]